MVSALGWLLIALGLGGAGYMLASVRAARRFLVSSPPTTSNFTSVTVLKPLAGAEPQLAENLESFCTQDYPGPIQLLIGVDSEQNAAIPVVDGLRTRHPNLDIALAAGSNPQGSNPKIANLVNMMPGARHDVLVLSDSDIGVAPDYLRSVISTLDQKNVGAVSCCYIGKPLDNVWSKLSAMGIDYQFLPSVLFGLNLKLAAPCFGSTIAIRKNTLAGIGGFDAFRDVLADDYEIGRAVRARGYEVAFAPIVVSHTCAETSAGELIRHELRWARTIRTVEPLGFLGSGITHAVPLGALGAAMTGFATPALFALAAILGARLFQKQQIDRAFGLVRFPLWLLLPRDVLSFGVFVSSYFTRRVDWRGARYRVDAEGALTHD
jgi:ceramide glucosyltransferase